MGTHTTSKKKSNVKVHAALPPLPVSIYQGDALKQVKDLPDPRRDFIESFNRHHPDGEYVAKVAPEAYENRYRVLIEPAGEIACDRISLEEAEAYCEAFNSSTQGRGYQAVIVDPAAAPAVSVAFWTVHIFTDGQYARTIDADFTERKARAFAEAFNLRSGNERAVAQRHRVNVPRPEREPALT